jgi:fido (protein-threonine AMPylation protein)
MAEFSLYIEELKDINGRYVSAARGFRTEHVFCVDKFDRPVAFAAPADIDGGMNHLMAVFAEEFAAASDRFLLSRTFARFYYGFIAIHPFIDANRRTAFVFLENRAAERSCKIESIDILRKVLLEGQVEAEMQKLIALFEAILKFR